jgi:hypothetical protein
MSKTDRLNFGQAIEAMKKGSKVQRSGWNGKGMWIKVIPGRKFKADGNKDFMNSIGEIEICSHIDMFSADEKQVVGWLASQTDILAEDWRII